MVVQGKISASTLALREALLAQQAAQQSDLTSLSVASGCNRTVDMQYSFVVSPVASPTHLDTEVLFSPSRSLTVTAVADTIGYCS